MHVNNVHLCVCRPMAGGMITLVSCYCFALAEFQGDSLPMLGREETIELLPWLGIGLAWSKYAQTQVCRFALRAGRGPDKETSL